MHWINAGTDLTAIINRTTVAHQGTRVVGAPTPIDVTPDLLV